MDRQGISSLPIIDDQWRILGCISLSDVKYLVLPQFKHLIRGLADGRDKMPVFCVYPDTKLRSVIAKLVATDSHRVWVTQPGNSVTKLGGSYTGGGNDIELRRSLSRGSAHSNANNPATNTSSSMGTGSGPLSLAGKAAGYESDGTSSDVSDTLSSGGSRHLAGGIVGMGSALVEGSVCGVVSLTDIMHVLSNRTQA
ncbi:Protein SDS23, partial [Zancudomyces culisetae]